MQVFWRNKGSNSEFQQYQENVQNQHSAKEQFLLKSEQSKLVLSNICSRKTEWYIVIHYHWGTMDIQLCIVSAIRVQWLYDSLLVLIAGQRIRRNPRWNKLCFNWLLLLIFDLSIFVTWEEQYSDFTNRDEHLWVWSLESMVLLLLLMAK